MRTKEYGLQITEWLPSRKDCEHWYQWFNGLGIPAAIVRRNDSFAVFRCDAVIRKNQHGKEILVKERTTIDGDPIVVVACNGYLYGGEIEKTQER